ncbi:MAG: glycosyltransferase, partial [Candidatus Acidiferrales bacterium]
MRKFNILHTIETAGPGGAETVVLNLASRLDSSRFRSVALLPREDWLSERLRERGVPTFFVDSKAWYDFRLPWGMARLIRQENIDLIHSHLPGQNFYSCAVGRLFGRRTIATYHGAIELSQSGGLRGGIQLGSVRRSADAVVVVCDHVGKMLREAGFPAEKIVRIYNGISVDRFQISGDGRLRRELGLRNGTKLVGTIANLRQSKGYEFFIQAARKVVDTRPDTRFVAVGDIDPVIAKPLFASIERLGLQDLFLFLGFRTDVPEILSELDVFVLSSVSEGFPLVALEAMASARPVVVTRSGGPQEIVEDGRTGLLIPPADPDALTGKICELLDNPERAAALARAARAKVESTFTLEKMVREYER